MDTWRVTIIISIVTFLSIIVNKKSSSDESIAILFGTLIIFCLIINWEFEVSCYDVFPIHIPMGYLIILFFNIDLAPTIQWIKIGSLEQELLIITLVISILTIIALSVWSYYFYQDSMEYEGFRNIETFKHVIFFSIVNALEEELEIRGIMMNAMLYNSQ